MNDELKQLINDAAKLLGYKHVADSIYDAGDFVRVFDPCDPERGDLMKVAEAAECTIDLKDGFVFSGKDEFIFTDHDSLCYAVLRAASAVLHSRGGV